jgi:hypothetical protein
MVTMFMQQVIFVGYNGISGFYDWVSENSGVCSTATFLDDALYGVSIATIFNSN